MFPTAPPLRGSHVHSAPKVTVGICWYALHAYSQWLSLSRTKRWYTPKHQWFMYGNETVNPGRTFARKLRITHATLPLRGRAERRSGSLQGLNFIVRWTVEMESGVVRKQGVRFSPGLSVFFINQRDKLWQEFQSWWTPLEQQTFMWFILARTGEQVL